MDFKRIEKILILVLLAINLIFIWMIFQKNYSLMDSRANYGQIDVEHNMRADDISINFNLDDQTQQATFMRLMDDQEFVEEASQKFNSAVSEVNDEEILVTLKEPISLPSSELNARENIKVIEELLGSEQVLYGEDYEFLMVDLYQKRYIYTQRVNGIPIYDGTAQIRFYVNENQEIMSYSQSRMISPLAQGEKRNLVTMEEAIETLYLNNELGKNVDLVDGGLIYSKILVLDNLVIYAPVWLFIVDDGNQINTLRVDAVNNTIMSKVTPNPSQS